MASKIDKFKVKSQAERYARKGKVWEAIAEYKKLLSRDIEDIQSRNILCDLYLKVNQKEKAIEELKKIAKHYEEKGLILRSIAIFKRIIKLDPENIQPVKQLADLYRTQGFTFEANREYFNLARKLKKAKKIEEATKIYEALLRVDPNDMDSKLEIAELYSAQQLNDMAVEKLNEVAEFKLRQNELKESRKILDDARKLKDNDLRTLTNLMELFKRENRKEELLKIVKDILKQDKKNVKALYILGNLYFEKGNFEEAEKIYLRIISLRPKEIEAKLKLGRIYIQRGNIDKAFQLYKPLIDNLITKQKTDKAIGLLGLILSSKQIHIPSLEKLAYIYKIKNQKENLITVYRIILEAYRKNNLWQEMLGILEELINLSPENEEYNYEYKQVKKKLAVPEKVITTDISSQKSEEGEVGVEIGLSMSELYIEQGLIRNAKRILEDLRKKFPDDDRIKQRINGLQEISSRVEVKDVYNRVKKVSGKEKITAADVFAETDIIPLISQGRKKKRYYDLTERIEDELEAINAIFNYQIRGDTTIVEKALSDIVSEFRKSLKEKVEKEDYETHYNLGIAFLEQELLDEAIDELKLASQKKLLEVECYSVLGYCYRKKEDLQMALENIQKAIDASEPESPKSFAFKYEEASLYEEMKNLRKALNIYNEIKKWNPEYRDVAEKVKFLEKNG